MEIDFTEEARGGEHKCLAEVATLAQVSPATARASSQNPFFTVVLRGVEQVAVHHDYLVMVCNSDQDPAREQMYAEALITELMGGVVLASTNPLGNAMSALLAAKATVVLIDRHSGEADLVDTAPRHVLLQPQLVVRASTGPARRLASVGKERR